LAFSISGKLILRAQVVVAIMVKFLSYHLCKELQSGMVVTIMMMMEIIIVIIIIIIRRRRRRIFDSD
jgi:hypothetical protein